MTELQFDARMSDADALMWTIEKDPLLRSTITTVATFDRPLDHDRFHAVVERATRAVPRLRQRVQANPWSIAPPRWEVDPNFDLSFHLRTVRVAGDGTLRDVLDLAEPIAMQGFDRARPLWEALVVDGLEGDRSALILKLHHSITDGVGGIELAMHLFDVEREGSPRDDAPPAPPAVHRNQLSRVVDALAHEGRRAAEVAARGGQVAAGALAATATDPAGAVRRAGETVGSVGRLLAPVTAPLSDVMTGRSLSMRFGALAVPVADLKAAGRKADGTLNDAFVAAVAGGLRRYHRRHGSSVRTLRMTMPINRRTPGSTEAGGNRFVPARFAFPIDVEDPVERMRALHDLLARERAEPALALTDPLAGVLRRLPTGVTTSVFGSLLKGIDVVTSNVPGIPVPVYLAGARMEAQYAFGPLSGAATNVVLLSYVDEALVGVNTDRAAIPDHDAFVEDLEAGFAEVLSIARPRGRRRRPAAAARGHRS